MAGPDAGPAIPVWLAEDDLGCIICHELLAWPTTLPCGHSFCRDCLVGLWEAGRRRSCPTCREGGAQPLQLRKNTMLQDLADKYSRAAHELKDRAPVPGPAPRPAPGPRCHTAQLRVAAQKSITEVGRELAELVDQLVDTVRSLQSQSCLPESEPDKDLRTLASVGSSGRRKNGPGGGAKDSPLAWLGIKLYHTRRYKAAFCYLRISSHEPSELAGHILVSFPSGAISPTFDLGSLSCSLESYPWSPERFASCQVLGSQGFSSGQRYWEVDTQRCSHWAVGVASRGMRRDQILGRTSDSWCVEWNGASQLSAWHVVKQTVLGSDRPGVVGIWLDFEKEKLAFYSVADQEKLLYEYPVSASFALYPAFWLYGLYPGNSLTVRQVNL
uniref:E3 ubiquitin-protein ligase RNF135 n=1 Tax=Sus scrofa TaxID=9823 RepID=A0A4X1TI24_PIG